MKKLFWILLLVNVLVLALLQQGWKGWGVPEPSAQAGLHADKMRLLNPSQGAPVAAAPTKTAVAPESLPLPALACLEWGDFTGTDLIRARDALSSMQLGDQFKEYQEERDIAHWVYFPPLKNKAEISRKISEIKALGITDYFVMTAEGPWQNAISLGVFQTQEAAEHFLDDMRNKGVRTATVGLRESKFKVTIFSIREVGILTKAKLAALQQEFSTSELKQIPCTLTR